MNIGNELKKARKEKGLSIDELQKKTKIRKKYLIALENNKFSEIKGEVYVKSFIKGYARAIGINPDPFIYEYDQYIVNKKFDTNNKNDVKNNKSFYKYKNFKKIIIILLVIIGLLTTGFLVYKNFISNAEKKIENNTTKVEYSLNENINFNENGTDNMNIIEKNEFNINSDKITTENSLELEKNKINFDNSKKSNKTNDEKDNINMSEKPQEKITENKNIEKNNNSRDDNNVEKNGNNEEVNKQEEITIMIAASETSWLRVTLKDNDDNESILYEGIMNKNEEEEITFNVDSSLKFRIGNGTGIYILNKDKRFGPWGERGEVLEKEIYFRNELKIN